MIKFDKYFLKNGDFIKCFFCGNSLFTSDRMQATPKTLVFTVLNSMPKAVLKTLKIRK